MAWVQEASHEMKQLPTVQILLPAKAHSPEMLLPPAFGETHMAFLLADRCLSPYISKNKMQLKLFCVEHFNSTFCWIEAG